MGKAHDLFYDLVDDAIDQIESGDGYWAVVGAVRATDEILVGLEPIADVLVALWRQTAEWEQSDYVHAALDALPQPLQDLLDKLISTTEET
jgi:hypothetical protein